MGHRFTFRHDENHSDDDTVYLNCFCEIVAGIHSNESGGQLKDLMVENGILDNALSYLNQHMPDHKKYAAVCLTGRR